MSTNPMSAARLIFVVHAVTAATRRAAFAGPNEMPDPAGLAAAAGLKLPEAHVAVSSPAAAAAGTARALGLKPRIEESLRDLDVGRWAGSPLNTIDPDELAAWIGNPLYRGHGGEAIAGLVERVRGFLGEHGAFRDTIVAVTHGAVVRAAMLATLDAPASAFWRIDAPPLATLVLTSDGRRWALRAFAAPPEVSIKASVG